MEWKNKNKIIYHNTITLPLFYRKMFIMLNWMYRLNLEMIKKKLFENKSKTLSKSQPVIASPLPGSFPELFLILSTTILLSELDLTVVLGTLASGLRISGNPKIIIKCIWFLNIKRTWLVLKIKNHENCQAFESS